MDEISDHVPPIPAESKLLFSAGLAIFSVTVIIGILNGLDVVDFSHNLLMTHVHAGTLGWITLAMMAAAIWMFAGVDDDTESPASSEAGEDATGLRVRGLTIFSIAAVVLYVGAFAAGILWLRPIVGMLVIIASAWFLWWLWQRGRSIGLNIARFGMILAACFLIIGGLLGIFLGLAMAGKFGLDGSRFAGSHPASMVAGYLVLGGAAVAEWCLEPAGRALKTSRAGVVQVILFFAAGIFLALGELTKVQAFLMLNLPCVVAGIVIVIVRLRKHFGRISWFEAGPGRHVGLTLIFLAANVGLISYAIARYAEDFSKVPTWLIFALDHVQFLGVVTNVFIAALLIGLARAKFGRPVVDHAVFWLLNVGMVGFVVGIMLESAPLKRIFAPAMGVALLVAIAANVVRMRSLGAPNNEGMEATG